MTLKKKTTSSKTVKTMPKAKIVKNNNSLFMLALACGVLVASYTVFHRVSNVYPAMNPATMPSQNVEMGMMEGNTLTLQLNEQNNSGEYGNAVLTEENGKTKVHIDIKGAPKGISQPAHIHVGSCIALGDVKYPLTNVVNGTSDTVLNISLQDMEKEGSLALNVHKSVPLVKQYVSCGNVE